MRLWQAMIRDWMFNEVKEPDQWNPTNRGQRLLEEVLEAYQCPGIGLTEDQCHTLVSYVYNRPTGTLHQELGGVIICLLALSDATEEDLHKCMIDEYNRICTPELIEKVRKAIIRKRADGVGI